MKSPKPAQKKPKTKSLKARKAAIKKLPRVELGPMAPVTAAVVEAEPDAPRIPPSYVWPKGRS